MFNKLARDWKIFDKVFLVQELATCKLLKDPCQSFAIYTSFWTRSTHFHHRFRSDTSQLVTLFSLACVALLIELLDLVSLQLVLIGTMNLQVCYHSLSSAVLARWKYTGQIWLHELSEFQNSITNSYLWVLAWNIHIHCISFVKAKTKRTFFYQPVKLGLVIIGQLLGSEVKIQIS